MGRLVLVAVVAVVAAVLMAGCGGDDDTAATEEEPTPASAEPTATPEPPTDPTPTVAPTASPTAEPPTPEPTAEPTEPQFRFDDIENEFVKERVDDLCQSAVVGLEGPAVFDEVIQLMIRTGEIPVPGFAEAIEEVAGPTDLVGSPERFQAFLILIEPICEEIGWTP